MLQVNCAVSIWVPSHGLPKVSSNHLTRLRAQDFLDYIKYGLAINLKTKELKKTSYMLPPHLTHDGGVDSDPPLFEKGRVRKP
jgi:hypothetical protein